MKKKFFRFFSSAKKHFFSPKKIYRFSPEKILFRPFFFALFVDKTSHFSTAFSMLLPLNPCLSRPIRGVGHQGLFQPTCSRRLALKTCLSQPVRGFGPSRPVSGYLFQVLGPQGPFKPRVWPRAGLRCLKMRPDKRSNTLP